jgi:hypothetical protein
MEKITAYSTIIRAALSLGAAFVAAMVVRRRALGEQQITGMKRYRGFSHAPQAQHSEAKAADTI